GCPRLQCARAPAAAESGDAGCHMTDEAAFQAGLDDNPRNHDLRLVFADWLEEQGDWRAASYRWMGTHRKHPYPADRSWDWWDASLRENLDDWTALERAQKILDHMAGRGPATRPTLEILGQFTEIRLTTRLMKRWFFAAMIRSDLFSLLENEVT